jgi:DNA polymerase/3'-5' exonuclease PolX
MPKPEPLCLSDAIRMKEELARILRPHLVRIVSAGSVRRLQPIVQDIELVAVPQMVPVPRPKQLFETEPPELVSALDRFAETLPKTGDLILDPDLKRNGPRYKRLRYRSVIAVDLFIVLPPAQLGAVLAIRTGDAEFSHLLVTKRSQGGAMPDRLSQREGALWEGLTLLPTDTEEAYFEALGLPWLPPSQRTAESLRKLLRKPVRV